MRLILERGGSGQVSIRGALHLQVDIHNDDDSIIDAYNEIETTVEKMKPTTITVMNYDHRPILEIVGVVITKLGSFGRAYFTAQSVKLIDAEEVKRFVIS